jgi:hypothetical protein
MNREELSALRDALEAVLAWPPAVRTEVARWLTPAAAKGNGVDLHPPIAPTPNVSGGAALAATAPPGWLDAEFHLISPSAPQIGFVPTRITTTPSGSANLEGMNAGNCGSCITAKSECFSSKSSINRFTSALDASQVGDVGFVPGSGQTSLVKILTPSDINPGEMIGSLTSVGSTRTV